MNGPLAVALLHGATGAKRRLLLVEDEPSLCHFLDELLEAEYVVETAFDGEQAWDSIQQERPDVVLSNVNMPVLDGVSLVQRLRASPATTTLPVILLTARLDHAVLENGLAAGANRLMQKPFRLEELLSTLRAVGQPLDDGHA